VTPAANGYYLGDVRGQAFKRCSGASIFG